ncbi:hypothetical protein Agub_g15389, partial [Astrephomene gubernaculifera]
YLAHCRTQMPCMDGRQLVGLLSSLSRLGLHGWLGLEWREDFLRASARLMGAGGVVERGRHQNVEAAAEVCSLAVGSGVRAQRQQDLQQRREAPPACAAAPAAAACSLTPSQLALLLLSVARSWPGRRPPPGWLAAFWAASAPSLPYMSPVSLSCLLGGVRRLRMSPPLQWTRRLFQTSEATLQTCPADVLLHLASCLLACPLRPPGSWVAAFRARLDQLAAALSRPHLRALGRMVRVVSSRRRHCAPPGWRLRSARSAQEAEWRWRHWRVRGRGRRMRRRLSV